MTTYTLGMDAAWGGWGWCLADAGGPVRVGHEDLKHRTWRWTALAETLDGLREELLPWWTSGASVRVVVERPPMHYRAASRDGRHANEAVVGYGIGQLTGPILTWAARPGWPYPWEVDALTWRSWWNIGGLRGGRPAYKLAAMSVCQRHGWAKHLEPYGWQSKPGWGPRVEDAERPMGDVAEAMLVAVGAAMRPELAPTGPKRPGRWTAP